MTEDHGQRQQMPESYSPSKETVEQATKPKQSYWPIALACSLTIALIGVLLMTHPIVFWVGVAFVIVSFVGWGLEAVK